jgi:hypothetical protein
VLWVASRPPNRLPINMHTTSVDCAAFWVLAHEDLLLGVQIRAAWSPVDSWARKSTDEFTCKIWWRGQEHPPRPELMRFERISKMRSPFGYYFLARFGYYRQHEAPPKMADFLGFF